MIAISKLSMITIKNREAMPNIRYTTAYPVSPNFEESKLPSMSSNICKIDAM